MYKIQNKTSGATDTVTDAQWQVIRQKKLTDDPQDKKTWSSKYKILEHVPDENAPEVSFDPPEIAMPEIQEPPKAGNGKSKKNSGDKTTGK